MLALVKVLVDGAVSALHVHDGSHLQVVSQRLASRLDACTTELADMLQTNPAGVLGERRLLWPFREFVQWNPADDAIVELRVRVSASDTWRLSGELRDLGA